MIIHDNEHEWIPVPEGGPLEEGAVCARCGAYANSESDSICATSDYPKENHAE